MKKRLHIEWFYLNRLDDEYPMTVRITLRLRDAVDEGMLGEALEATRQRYPYLCVRLGVVRDDDLSEHYVYEDNPKPWVLSAGREPVRLFGDEAGGHFVRWAADLTATEMKPYFYPDLDKSVLFEQEYIMEKSGHTRGSTVDLTLFDMASEKELDMGGTFDWFGPESHPDFCGNPETCEYTGDNSKSPATPKRSITEQQFKNRMILRRAMLAHGFKPLDTEWWHFTLKDEPFPDTYFTFPVKQLNK